MDNIFLKKSFDLSTGKETKFSMETKEELSYIYNLLSKFKDSNRSVVNIGVYYGSSAAVILKAMSDFNISGKLYLIDVFKYHRSGSPKTIPFKERKDIPWTDSFLHKTKENLKPYASNVDVVYLEQFSDDVDISGFGECSFIFIDGDHSLQSCLMDLLKYSQNVCSGGMIANHDSHFPSVNKAIEMFLKIRPDYKRTNKIGTIQTIVKG